MTVTEVAKDSGRPMSTVNSWISAGHLKATWVQPVGPDGAPFGSPSWFIEKGDWMAAKEKCLTLKRGRPFGSTSTRGISDGQFNTSRDP